MSIEFGLILQLILEGLKALKKDKIEELKKEWKKYESELTQALASGDVARINAILAELRAL
jgi:RNA polymerase-interacting CarD/CdnL/TRCF family regulator